MQTNNISSQSNDALSEHKNTDDGSSTASEKQAKSVPSLSNRKSSTDSTAAEASIISSSSKQSSIQSKRSKGPTTPPSRSGKLKVMKQFCVSVEFNIHLHHILLMIKTMFYNMAF